MTGVAVVVPSGGRLIFVAPSGGDVTRTNQSVVDGKGQPKTKL